MTRFELGGVAALMLSMASAACMEPPVESLSGADKTDQDETPDEETSPKKKATTTTTKGTTTTTGAETEASPAASEPTAINVSFAASTNQKFGNIAIHRSCSDMGVDFNQASLADATSLTLVNVVDGKVLAKVEGEAFKALKNEVVQGSGSLDIPVDKDAVPTEAAEYALIAGGDGRFGSPAACGVSLQPKDDQDRGIKGGAGRFPTGRTIIFDRGIGGTGCGIVGFLQAYYDSAQGKVYARPTSPLLIAADDEGRAGFPKGNSYKGCDAHASPLVLDLGGDGVTLGAAREDVFDIDGNGTRDALGWITSNETPLLVRDANENGVVDGAAELFGDHTTRPDGRGSSNGFEALAAFDDVEDGVIDARDRVWKQLRLWFDRDRDGRTGPGELETLEARGVRSIATGYVSVTQRLSANGKLQGSIRQRGGATLSDGRTVAVVDVWFERRF